MDCPYCKTKIILEKINCGIFRCGIYQLKNGKFRQLPKHGSKNRIDTIKNKYKVYGCGNPVKYHKKTKTLIKTNWSS